MLFHTGRLRGFYFQAAFFIPDYGRHPRSESDTLALNLQPLDNNHSLSAYFMPGCAC